MCAFWRAPKARPGSAMDLDIQQRRSGFGTALNGAPTQPTYFLAATGMQNAARDQFSSATTATAYSLECVIERRIRTAPHSLKSWSAFP